MTENDTAKPKPRPKSVVSYRVGSEVGDLQIRADRYAIARALINITK
jgi:hypothetical protein